MQQNLRELEDLGCLVMHEVDAHTMSKHPLLNQNLFDRIVFNFPAISTKHVTKLYKLRQEKCMQASLETDSHIVCKIYDDRG